jgi:hypothetical protein
MPAGQYPVWQNRDTVPHSVVFANGLCALQVAPGAFAQCDNGFSGYVGRYAYTVDGTIQASVDIVAAGRAVTLAARSHRIARHSSLPCTERWPTGTCRRPARGSRNPLSCSRATIAGTRSIASRPSWRRCARGQLVWHLRVRPRARAIYVAEANFQPQGGQVWQQARSRPFKVRLGG